MCVRVSWEVTRACQVHLPLDDLFAPITKSTSTKAVAGEGKDSLSLVESAIRCCKEWRTCYVEVSVVLGSNLHSPYSPLPSPFIIMLPPFPRHHHCCVVIGLIFVLHHFHHPCSDSTPSSNTFLLQLYYNSVIGLIVFLHLHHHTPASFFLIYTLQMSSCDLIISHIYLYLSSSPLYLLPHHLHPSASLLF